MSDTPAIVKKITPPPLTLLPAEPGSSDDEAESVTINKLLSSVVENLTDEPVIEAIGAVLPNKQS